MLYFNINFCYWVGKYCEEIWRAFSDIRYCPPCLHHKAENTSPWSSGSSTLVSIVTTPLSVGSVAWGTPNDQGVVSSSNSIEQLLHLMLARIFPWGSRSPNHQSSKFQGNKNSANGLWVFIVRVATVPFLDTWICLFWLVEDRPLIGLWYIVSHKTKSNYNWVGHLHVSIKPVASGLWNEFFAQK